jgi:hypothetical protein
MLVIRSFTFFLFLVLPIAASASVSANDLPEGTLWYLHADLEQMRNTESGRDIYRWLDGEIFLKIHEELGIDINKEMDSITAFSNAVNGTVILIEGPMTHKSQDKVIALATLSADLAQHEFNGKDYYFVQHEDSNNSQRGSNKPLKDLEDGAYFSFAISNKLLISGNEEQMKELLSNKGKVAGSESHEGALFVLTADRAFVQAGLNTGELAEDGDDWNSNILRNTEHAALMVADSGGMISIEAELVSTDPKMAQSLGGIANGLISLQAFNSDLDVGIRNLLSNLKVDVKENVLSISMVIAADVIVSVLNN